MTTWYVDLSQTYEATYAVSVPSQSEPWGGCAGVQRAIAAAQSGDTILVANAADPAANQPMTALFMVELTDTTGFTVGGEITNESSAGTGRVAAIATNAYVLYELVSGAFMGGITVSGDGGTTTVPAGNVSIPGLQIDDAICVDGPITLTGVAADWVTGERAYFDCDSECNGIVIGSVDGWTLHRIEVNAPVPCGIYKEAASVQTGWIFEDLQVTNAAFAGAYAGSLLRPTFRRFDVIDAGSYGIYTAPTGGRFEHCVLSNGMAAGFDELAEDSVVEGCLIVGNGVGIDGVASGCSVVGCIIDGSASHGVVGDVSANSVRLLHNRITHNGGWGIDATDAAQSGWVIDRNVFFANASGPVVGVEVGDDNHGPAGSGLAHEDVTGDGYVDRAGGNYMLAADALMRREPLALDDINSTFIAAGLVSDDLPRQRTANKRGNRA